VEQWTVSAAVKMDKGKQQQQQQRQRQHRHDTSTTLDGVNSDYPELHVVFEFFTDNPQKTMPVDANSPQKDSPYYDPYWDAIRSMQSNENFLEGMLLRSVDCNRKQSLPLSVFSLRRRSIATIIAVSDSVQRTLFYCSRESGNQPY